MENNMNLNINALMDITDLPGVNGEPVQTYEPLELKDVKSNPTERSIDMLSDYEVVRNNLHQQNQMLFDAAKVFLETAKNADSPRHMEVFTSLIGQMTTTNKEIVKLHKEMKDITNETTGTNAGGQQPASINVGGNAQVFIGSPTDMLDQLGDAFEAKQLQQSVVGEG